MFARVAVVIPTYNRGNLLAFAIESALQAVDEAQIIVVDSGSTDSTLQQCAGRSDLRYVRIEQNRGPSVARNVGAKNAKTKYIAFLDDDDLLLPGALNKLAQKLDRSPSAALCYGQIQIGDENCTPTGGLFPPESPEGDVFWRLMQSNFIMTHAALVRRECLDQVGPFDPKLRHNEDWDIWVRLAERWPFVALHEPVGIVRRHARNQLSAGRKAMYRAASLLHRRWLELPRAAALPQIERQRLQDEFDRCRAAELVGEAFDQLKTGRIAPFADYLAAAFVTHPSSAVQHAASRVIKKIGRQDSGSA